jgi:hypothetical protein
MKKLVLAVMVSALTTGAWAQNRPTTTAMACGQAARLVASRGAVILATGGNTYDRFVSDGRFCLTTETSRRRHAAVLHRLPLQGTDRPRRAMTNGSARRRVGV